MNNFVIISIIYIEVIDMKKFIISLFFVIFTLFNVCGEDLLHPVIRDDIDEDIKKIEQALVDYVLYPEMVERGFDVHQLDNMKIDGEMFEYIESFFRPNEEKGWLPLDNHHVLQIIDENGKRFTSNYYHKRILFSNEYGTKDELLEKGYVENETMFYYPSNGEKDWRVGKWSWFDWLGEWNVNRAIKCNFEGMKEIKADNTYILETKKSYVIKIDGGIFNDTFENINLPKKEYLIIDALRCTGGKSNECRKLVEQIKKSKYKKIIVLIDDTSSAGERLALLLKDDKRVIYIGENTNGQLEGRNPEVILNLFDKNEKIRFNITLSTDDNILDIPFLGEGIGCLPNIWARNALDIMKNLWRITEDYELKFKFSPTQIIDHNNYQKYKNGL